MDVAAEEMATVGHWPSLAEADEYALVVLAMNQDCRVRPLEGLFALDVEPGIEPAVRRELALYAAEQAPVAILEDEDSVVLKPLLAAPWVIVLMVMYGLQVRDPGMEMDLLNSSYGLYAEGEWWRPITALFLHADFPHLLGNVVIGGVFCVLVAGLIGAWRGWFLILLSGAIGNALTAWIHWPNPFLSLGASTATFGALGILVGLGLRSVLDTHHFSDLKSLIGPFGGGLALLFWFGTSGVDTDVLGHFMGWGAGCLLGLLVSQRGEQE